MKKEQLLPITVSLPKSCRDCLRRLAAKQSLENPDKVVTSAGLARKILCEYLEKQAEMERSTTK